MKNKFASIFVIVLSVAAGAVGSYFLFRGESLDDLAVGKTVAGSRVVKTASNGSVKKIREVSVVVKPGGKRAVRIVETSQVRPGVGVESEIDEENLTAEQKIVMKELQAALDANDLKQVRKAISKFSAKVEEGGLGGRVPVCMRSKAVEALGWFGKAAAVDLIEFMADANEEVASEAGTQFDQALSDCGMGDVERSQLMTAALTALTDADQIDTLLNQMNDMRNSVKVQSAKTIMTTGSEAAKKKLLEEMEFYFEEGVKDLDTLDKWGAKNPDDPDDSETYGPSK